MNQEPAPTSPPPIHQTQQQSTADYPSNPIETAKQGLNALWQNGRSALGGVIVIGAILATVTTILGLIAMLALLVVVFATWAQNDTASSSLVLTMLTAQLPPETSQLVEAVMNMSGIALGVFAVSGLAAAAVGAFLQALSFAYVGVSVVHNQTAHLGEITRLAFKRTLPLLGLGLLCLAVIAVTTGLPFVIVAQAPVLAPIFSLYIFVLIIVLIVLGMRLSFAPLAVVVEGLGPIKSLQRSWTMTKGRVWEILGVTALVTLATLALELVLTPVRSAMPDNLALLWALIELVVSILVGTAALAAIAQRYAQFQKVDTTTGGHKVAYGINIGLIAAAIVAAIIVGSVQASMQPKPSFEDINLDDTYNTDYLDRDGNPLFEDTQPPTDQDYNQDYDFDSGLPTDDGSYDYNYDEPSINYQ